MELGYFAMPSHPPERDLKEGFEFDLQVIKWLDQLGYTEAWIGEHHTAPWEPHPATAGALPGSIQAASCCPIIPRPNWRTASPCSTTSPTAG